MSTTPLSTAQRLFFFRSFILSFLFFFSIPPSPNSKDHTLLIVINIFYPLFCESRHHGAVQHVFCQAHSKYCPKDRCTIAYLCCLVVDITLLPLLPVVAFCTICFVFSSSSKSRIHSPWIHYLVSFLLNSSFTRIFPSTTILSTDTITLPFKSTR